MRASLIVTILGTVLTAGALASGPTATADDGSAAPRAEGSTVVGQTGTPLTCTPGPSTWVQQATGAAAPKYVVPGPGVITSFSHNANGTAGSIRAVVVSAGSTPTNRTIVGYSELRTLTPNTLNTFPTRIPVPLGAGLGLYISSTNIGCNFGTADAADQITGAEIDPTATSSYVPGAGNSFSNRRLNLSVVWEPDVDKDGYGDVSQDVCPQSAATQAACPAPETTVTKSPAKRSAKRLAKIKFTSVPGATFTCAVDDKNAKPCSSPFKRRYKIGKHVVVVTAVSNVGILDPTPVKAKFRIVEHR
jgi:hypothetical protein